MAARFLLGSFEACVAPTFIAIVQMWYRRGEQTVRNAAWYAQLGVVNIVSLQGLSVYMYTVTDLYRAARKSSQLRVSPHCIKHPLPVPDHLSFLRSAHRYAELHSLQQHQSTDTPHSPLLSRSIHLAPRLTNASPLPHPRRETNRNRTPAHESARNRFWDLEMGPRLGVSTRPQNLDLDSLAHSRVHSLRGHHDLRPTRQVLGQIYH
jgi:hypothetical protein